MAGNKPNSKDIFSEDDFPVGILRQSVMSGTGVDMAQAAQKPIIAIANSHTELNPGHMHLDQLAAKVREGVIAAGGIPFEFNVPAPCDGIAMGHQGMRFVLAQRDLIADTVEIHIRSMRFDGVVMVASCDKIIPGMLMAAARLDLPTTFITGGPGAFQIRYRPGYNGSIEHADYPEWEDKAATMTCATCGSCEIMGTANTFQCMTEALGLSLPGSATIPAFNANKARMARMAGARVVELVEQGFTARQCLTSEALHNAVTIDMAIGGSTNATLHLPALANELELELTLADFNRIGGNTPTVCAVAPSGSWGVGDLHRAGGIPAVMHRVSGLLKGKALNVGGCTIGEIAAQAVVYDEAVILPLDKPHSPTGGTVAMWGNLAPDGCVVKQAAVKPEMHAFIGTAKVFDNEADCLKAIREGALAEGDVVVIRYEGPKGSPGMPEMLACTTGIDLAGFQQVALVTDGRFSGATKGPCVGHVSPEAYVGGPIAIVQDGDKISIDIANRQVSLLVDDEEIKARLARWNPVDRPAPPGYMRRYRKLVGSAAKGAIIG